MTLWAHDEESLIEEAIWTFGVEGIIITRKAAEEELMAALSEPLPDFD